MKKLLVLLTFVSLLVFSNAFAQTGAYNDKEIIGSAGIALGGLNGGFGSVVTPAIYATGDYNMYVNGDLPLSFGGVLAYQKSEDEYTWFTTSYKWTYTNVVVGARAAYHFGDLLKSIAKNGGGLYDKLDPYAGLLLGYNMVSVEFEGDSATEDAIGDSSASSYLLFGGYAGFRYYFTDKIAMHLESGVGLGIFNGGISYRF
jgi:hypothetical protein